MSTATTIDSNVPSPAKGFHIALWVVQALLAVAFLMSGFMKLSTPVDVLAAQMPWVKGAMGPFVRFIGAAELAGALGLVLPAATRIQPRLTALAALGLATIMLLAALTHASRGEWPVLFVNGILGSLAAFVAWGRSKAAPIHAR